MPKRNDDDSSNNVWLTEKILIDDVLMDVDHLGKEPPSVIKREEAFLKDPYAVYKRPVAGWYSEKEKESMRKGKPIRNQNKNHNKGGGGG